MACDAVYRAFTDMRAGLTLLHAPTMTPRLREDAAHRGWEVRSGSLRRCVSEIHGGQPAKAAGDIQERRIDIVVVYKVDRLTGR